MFWLIFLIIAVVFLALLYRRNRGLSRAPVSGSDLGRRKTEASTEIGVPPEALDPEESLRRDRQAGVERPRVRPSRRLGALKHRNLRKDSLSKEVELAWEAGETIEFQPGANVRTNGPASDRQPPARDLGTRPRSPWTYRDEDYFLPEKYGMDRLVLMARDPQWVYAYWEITHEKYRYLIDKRLAQWGLTKPALRIYDVTRGLPEEHMDIVVAEDADNWYIHVDRPEHTIVAELGRLVQGEFVPFIRSNPVTIPARTYSMEAAEERPGLDWERLYGNYVARYYDSSPMLWRK